MQIHISKAKYNGPPKKISNSAAISTTIGGVPYTLAKNDIDVAIPNDFFSSTSSNTDDDYNPYTSHIIIENAYVTDSEGVRIDTIDKDSPPFTLVVTYIDRGLREVDDDEFTSNSLEVYLTEPGGFVAAQGQKGTLKYMNTNSNEAPRFQARFQNVTYDGSGASVGITAYYDIMGYEVEGKSPVWKVAAVDDEEEDKLKPLIPHIIVSQYSYGDEQINAGDNFTLSMSVTNTSPDIPLENIVMTIAPYIPENTDSSTTGGLTITSASNTKYIASLGVGESFSHTIDLRAEASAAVGSHRVEVEFSFQYVDEVNKVRESSTDKESIAIPVSQVDRFSVDPLTELPDMLYEGEEGYVTLSFVNRGKAITRNLSGTISGNMANAGQIVHYGNLEAGGADTMDFEVMAATPGEMTGEILLQYEDENENQKEITIPFSIRVEEMYYPEYDDPGMMEQPAEEQGLGLFTIIFCVVGGLLIAAPITLYLHKRVKAKGIEELDEDI